MKATPILLIACLTICHTTAQASAQPTPFVAHYDAYTHGMSIGIATKTLERIGPEQYRYSIKPSIRGFMRLIMADDVSMQSLFEVEHEHIKPLQYTYQQIGRRTDKHIEINFTTGGKEACDHVTGQCWHNATDTLYDPLSVDFAYPMALQQSLTNHQYEVVTGEKDHTDQTQFKVMAEETIAVGAGEFNTIKVIMTAAGKKRPDILWLAKDLDYFPVQIIQQHKQYAITFKLKDYQNANQADSTTA